MTSRGGGGAEGRVSKLDNMGSSTPRDDLRHDPMAVVAKGQGGGYVEVSLQQYLGTNVVQWHGKRRGSYYWEAFGPVMRILAEEDET